MRLMLNSEIKRNTPGIVAIHHALIKYFLPSAMMLPKVGTGGCTPIPMKPRIAS